MRQVAQKNYWILGKKEETAILINYVILYDLGWLLQKSIVSVMQWIPTEEYLLLFLFYFRKKGMFMVFMLLSVLVVIVL